MASCAEFLVKIRFLVTDKPLAVVLLPKNLDFTKKLGNSLELSLQYEGRKAGDTGIVHTGRASLRALL